MSAPLTGWSALRLVAGLVLIFMAYCCWRYYREVEQGLHQWPNPQGRLYREWMALPHDQTPSDYYTWLAELKGRQEPWATWAKWQAESDPLTSALERERTANLEQERKSARFLHRLEQVQQHWLKSRSQTGPRN
jgi:hypothetical protein